MAIFGLNMTLKIFVMTLILNILNVFNISYKSIINYQKQCPRSVTALIIAGHKCVLCSKAYDSLKGLKIHITRIHK